MPLEVTTNQFVGFIFITYMWFPNTHQERSLKTEPIVSTEHNQTYSLLNISLLRKYKEKNCVLLLREDLKEIIHKFECIKTQEKFSKMHIKVNILYKNKHPFSK